tara:strand:- start:79 stop:573 length:495 start_codon:yes stop_codon:yes gene_type:complete
MEKNIKISIGILVVLAVSRFIPHPPNFTSLISLSFYVPALLGLKFLPFVLFSFIFTDIIIGFHNTLFFTWGSVILIGIIANKFVKSITSRITGALIGALIFFVVTNFGVWSLGSYGYDFNGFLACYTLAIPFFGYSLVSTLFFSLLIEGVISIKKINSFLVNLK